MERRELPALVAPLWTGNWKTNLGLMLFFATEHHGIQLNGTIENPEITEFVPTSNVLGTTLTGQFRRYLPNSNKKEVVGLFKIALDPNPTGALPQIFTGVYSLKNRAGVITKGQFHGNYEDCPDGSQGAFQAGCDLVKNQVILQVDLVDSANHQTKVGSKVGFTATVQSRGPFTLPDGRAGLDITFVEDEFVRLVSLPLGATVSTKTDPFLHLKSYVVHMNLPALKPGSKFKFQVVVEADPSMHKVDADLVELVGPNARPAFSANGKRDGILVH